MKTERAPADFGVGASADEIQPKQCNMNMKKSNERRWKKKATTAQMLRRKTEWQRQPATRSAARTHNTSFSLLGGGRRWVGKARTQKLLFYIWNFFVNALKIETSTSSICHDFFSGTGWRAGSHMWLMAFPWGSPAGCVLAGLPHIISLLIYILYTRSRTL